MKSVDLVASYLTGDGEVSLHIVVGDAQIGASVVKLNKKVLAQGEIEGLELGNGLVGKTLSVKSVVTDVNDRSNKSSITYIFKCGSQVQEFTSKAELQSNGDSLIYRAVFKLL
jgi:hypothetical protein